jgi:hypothetical protein
MNRDEIETFIEGKDIALINGMDDAFIGICERIGMLPVAAYDTEKCIKILEENDGMEHEDAVEYFGFNIIGAWEGESTAVFITSIDE